VFANAKDHLTGERASFASEPGDELGGTLVFGFDGRDGQDYIGVEGVGDLVRHLLWYSLAGTGMDAPLVLLPTCGEHLET
jgi:hypothetical protein